MSYHVNVDTDVIPSVTMSHSLVWVILKFESTEKMILNLFVYILLQ